MDIDRITETLKSAKADPTFVGAYVGVCESGLFQHRYSGYQSADLFLPITSKSRFPLRHYEEPLIALLCCQLHVDGVLDCDAPIGSYLPELRSRGSSAVRISDFLSHTTGYFEPQMHNPSAHMTWSDLTDFFNKKRTYAEPGQIWAKGSSSYAILARLLEVVSGRTLAVLFSTFFESGEVADAPTILFPRGVHDHYLAPNGKMRGKLHKDAVKGPYGRALMATYSSMSGFGRLSAIMGGPMLPPTISDTAFHRFSSTRIVIPETCTWGTMSLAPRSYGLGLGKYDGSIGAESKTANGLSRMRWRPDDATGYVVYLNSNNEELFNALCTSTGLHQEDKANNSIALPENVADLMGYYESTSNFGGYAFARMSRGGIEIFVSTLGVWPFLISSEDLRDENRFKIYQCSAVGTSIGFGLIADCGQYIIVNEEVFIKSDGGTT